MAQKRSSSFLLSHIDTLMRHRGVILVLSMLAALHLIAVVAILHDAYMDDAYIGFRYVKNAVSGMGLTYNPFVRVEGVTNIGWLLLLIPFSYFLKVTVVAKVVGIVAIVLTAWLSYVIARQLSDEGCHPLFRAAMPLLVITNMPFLFFTAIGMETSLLALLLCTTVYVVLKNKHLWLVPLLCGYGFLVHPETLLVYPIATLLLLVARQMPWRKLLFGMLLFGSVIAIVSLLRYSYYSAFLPNTFYAKPNTLSTSVRQVIGTLYGGNWNIAYPFTGVFGILFVVLGGMRLYVVHAKATLLMTAIVMTGLLFSMYANPDWSEMARYFAPYTPVAFVMMWRGIVETIAAFLGKHFAQAIVTLCIAATGGMLVTGDMLHMYRYILGGKIEMYPGYILTARRLVEPSLWIRDHLPDDAVVATRRIGALGYYGERTVFDYRYGLTEPRVARLGRDPSNALAESPQNPALADLWRAVSPDYLLEDLSKVERYAQSANGSIDRFEIHGLVYGAIKQWPLASGGEWVLCKRLDANAR